MPSSHESQERLDEAIERLSLPEQIDQRLAIVQPRGWIPLAVIAGLLALFILWSFLGRIPIEVSGRSVALSAKGVFTLTAQAPGTVTEIPVKQGEWVEKGALIANVHNPQQKSSVDQIESIKFKIDKTKSELEVLEQRLKARESLFKDGLVSRIVLEDSKLEFFQKQVALEEAYALLSNHLSELQKVSFCSTKELNDLEIKLRENQISKLDLTSCLSKVYSPEGGKVLEVFVRPGDQVNVKDPLIWMEHPLKENESLVFFGAVSVQGGEKIAPGMRVLIEPVNVDVQEYGSLIGRVREVSTFAVSEEELLNILRNKQLINYLKGGDNVITKVMIDPALNSKTVSGYAWTSGEGPPFKIGTGTIGKISVIVEEQPPISYLIPLWRIKSTYHK